MELRALETLETKMDKKIGFRQAQLAGFYWGKGDGWNGYTGMERTDGLSHPTHKKLDFCRRVVHGSGLIALNEPTVVPR